MKIQRYVLISGGFTITIPEMVNTPDSCNSSIPLSLRRVQMNVREHSVILLVNVGTSQLLSKNSDMLAFSSQCHQTSQMPRRRSSTMLHWVLFVLPDAGKFSASTKSGQNRAEYVQFDPDIILPLTIGLSVFLVLSLSWSGALQRESEPVREAGGVGHGRPIPAVHRGVRDHPVLWVSYVPLPEAVPGVRPAEAHQGCGAPGQDSPQPHPEEQRQTLLWAVQDQLSGSVETFDSGRLKDQLKERGRERERAQS